MVWGYFSYNGVGKLVKIKGKMDSKQYIEKLANNLEESITSLKLENPIFQHGNDKAY
ncbi:transposable element tcb1 transposase [Ecytonucleospora hepatopenaei]|uniref:Transposable element tcb1 transposase n=1 Tax=Ecytonucleospora hepatopenaei TaxID=646526 RepID=A0A1W0E983_9MICR|nr:transposable element tcb1 transposase [Ecytonucleospora hepatopenaei]